MARRRRIRGGGQKKQTLQDWLLAEEYSLALAPAFFGFFAYVGALKALHEADLLKNVKYLSGASAGAMVAGMLAAGMSPDQMASVIVTLDRKSFWDPPAIGGLLKGKKFQDLIDNNLPVKTFEECETPVAVTGFNLLGFRTEIIDRGSLADAIVASATFPGMFAPVFRKGSLLIDGGVCDPCGLMGIRMAGGAKGQKARILNLGLNNSQPWGPNDIRHSILRSDGSVANSDLEVVSLYCSDLPKPSPFALEEGAKAIDAGYNIVKDLLRCPLEGFLQSPGHYVIQVTGGGLPSPSPTKERKRHYLGLQSPQGSKKSKIIKNNEDAPIANVC